MDWILNGCSKEEMTAKGTSSSFTKVLNSQILLLVCADR
jgi:hypothetical protein